MPLIGGPRSAWPVRAYLDRFWSPKSETEGGFRLVRSGMESFGRMVVPVRSPKLASRLRPRNLCWTLVHRNFPMFEITKLVFMQRQQASRLDRSIIRDNCPDVVLEDVVVIHTWACWTTNPWGCMIESSLHCCVEAGIVDLIHGIRQPTGTGTLRTRSLPESPRSGVDSAS